MKLSPDEETTLRAYQSSAEPWAKAHNTADFWAEELAEFHQALPTGRVLEVGCGGGRDAQLLISMGYDYIGTDPVPELIEIAQAENPSGQFVVRSVYDLALLNPMPYDGFWACAVLLHIPRARINEALQEIRSVVRVGGIGFISLKEGDGQSVIEEGEAGQSIRRLFTFWQLNEFVQTLEANGFRTVTKNRKPVSEKTTWLNYIVRAM
jgi:SAM-dependent methyltransferase